MAAHLALLDDPDLHADAATAIGQGKSAGFAWSRALDVQAAALRGLDDSRLQARAQDLVDLKRQVLAALSGETSVVLDLPADAILIADDILPSELMALGDRILGLCTAGGGPTSHVAIIAAALNLPAIAAAGPEALLVKDGTPVILDAAAGSVRLDPTTDQLAQARSAADRRRIDRAAALSSAGAPCRTADGVRIEIFANLAGVSEAATAVMMGAEGCGLLRSEFLFMDRPAAPNEDEQAAAYQAIADGLEGRPLIIRTLDIGGDKPVAYLALPKEDNPALGLRGVRTSLWRPDLLRAQLRAILRVSPTPKIMLPMITSVAELRAVRAILDEERRALSVGAVALGVMIETPAAAVTAASLALEANFFSIGTNDLTQYALAMDRTNPAVAAGVDAMHPAVLRLIALTCDGARTHGRTVGVCGGLASEPVAAALLIGLGVTELSATPSIIPELKAWIRTLSLNSCRVLAADALAQSSASAVRALLNPVDAHLLETVRCPPPWPGCSPLAAP
jgi:phosphocarrier protein FPr/phosphocarrier protein